MRQEIKWFISVFVLGMGLVAYANANFVSRDVMQLVLEDIRYIKVKVDKLHERSNDKSI